MLEFLKYNSEMTAMTPCVLASANFVQLHYDSKTIDIRVVVATHKVLKNDF